MPTSKIEKRATFGVAGNPPNFFESSFRKERGLSPLWLQSIGLDALEIQCTYGVRMPEERIAIFRENALKCGIALSIHGPYYINIGTSSPSGEERSRQELTKAVDLAKNLGSDRVIFHPGGILGEREKALARAVQFLQRFERENDCGQVCLYPEIAGKVGQLGSLDEILIMCHECSIALPCLDLAHLHAREQGSLRERDDFEKVFDTVESTLGARAIEKLHVHFYPVHWGNGGEIGHKAFFDKKASCEQLSLFDNSEEDCYRPRYEEFLDVVSKRNLTPTVICEAKDSQDQGALEMKAYYLKNRSLGGTRS